MEETYGNLLENGWQLSEIEGADYFLLLGLFNKEKESEKTVDGADFIKRFLSPDELAKLNHEGSE
ncbi:hypothetical protein [Enterococcus phage Phi_Eg_SY1]|nr:hypothetical protein [Enterococcus phage Phi_Eg_SY1]